MLEYSMYDKQENIKRAKIDRTEYQNFINDVVVYGPWLPSYDISDTFYISDNLFLDDDSYILMYASLYDIKSIPGDMGIQKAIPIGETLELTEDEKRIVDFYAEQYRKLIPDGEFIEFFDSIK